MEPPTNITSLISEGFKSTLESADSTASSACIIKLDTSDSNSSLDTEITSPRILAFPFSLEDRVFLALQRLRL